MDNLEQLLTKCAHQGCGWDREWHLHYFKVTGRQLNGHEFVDRTGRAS